MGIRPKKRENPVMVQEAKVLENGLEGDHHVEKGSQKRQVTLIQKEHLATVAAMMDRDTVDPLLTRRNVVVEGINLQSLIKRKFAIGDAVLEGTDLCHPCKQMEANLGVGGLAAMAGHGGITAKIIKGGTIRLNDEVRAIDD